MQHKVTRNSIITNGFISNWSNKTEQVKYVLMILLFKDIEYIFFTLYIVLLNQQRTLILFHNPL